MTLLAHLTSWPACYHHIHVINLCTCLLISDRQSSHRVMMTKSLRNRFTIFSHYEMWDQNNNRRWLCGQWCCCFYLFTQKFWENNLLLPRAHEKMRRLKFADQWVVQLASDSIKGVAKDFGRISLFKLARNKLSIWRFCAGEVCYKQLFQTPHF